MKPGRPLSSSAIVEWIKNQQPDPAPTEQAPSHAAVRSGFSRVVMLPGEISSILSSSKRSLCGGGLIAIHSRRPVLSFWPPKCRVPAVGSDPIAWAR